MKKAILALAIVCVVGAIAFGWSRIRRGDEAPSDVHIAAVERGSIRTVVSCTGRVVPNLTVQIKCKASGAIIKLPYDVSDTVQQGDLLLQVDPVDEERLVRQAEAALSASEARLQTAKLNLTVARQDLVTDKMRAAANLKAAAAHAKDARAKADRMKELLTRKFASPEEAETAETTAAQLEAEHELAQIQIEDLKTREKALDEKVYDVQLAEAQVETDKLTLEIRKQGLLDTKVVAPIAGVVSERSVEPGQIISSGISNVGGGTTAMVLCDLSRVFVLASVDESDIGRVAVGQQAEVTTDAFPGRTFEGRVVRIATQGVNVSNVVTFEVKIEVAGQDKSLLKPEMTTNVVITAAQKDDVLTVPVEAVIRRGKEYVVDVVADGVKAERRVEVGLNDGLRREIISGLRVGDRVVVHKEDADSRWNATRQSNQRMMPPPPPPGG